MYQRGSRLLARARGTLRGHLGPPRRSSAEVGRATGARPMPHSALTSLSARRAVVASLSLPRSVERKVTLGYLPVVRALLTASKLSARFAREATSREESGASCATARIFICDTCSISTDLRVKFRTVVVKVIGSSELRRATDASHASQGAKTMLARMF